jgi:hypothetical protein
VLREKIRDQRKKQCEMIEPLKLLISGLHHYFRLYVGINIC